MKTIVVIDGIDGSGKSTFARNLRDDLAACGHKATIVSVDDFRRPIAWDALEIPEVDAYYNSYYDLNLAEHCLGSFLRGESHVTIPRYDLLSERIDGMLHLDFVGASLAIVEGVFPLRIPSVASSFLVFLEVSMTEARRRIITRDMKKGRTQAETERRIDRRYFPSQERYRATCAPRQRADIVIDNEMPATPRIVRRDVARANEPLRSALDRLLPH
jgi:uridine kinase